MQFLQRVTEPVLYPIRRRNRGFAMGIDLSPIIALLIIIFLQVALVQSLKDLSIRMYYGKRGNDETDTAYIQQMVFKVRMRGHDCHEVKQFLEDIAQTVDP